MNKTRFTQQLYLCVLFLFFVVAFIRPASVCAQQPDGKETTLPDSISALDLHNAFKNDPESAKKLYSDKTYIITGIAVYVGPDVYTLPSVELSDKNGGKSKALCVLPFSDYLKLRKVSKGDEMAMKGKIRGYSEKYDVVVVKECTIVERANQK